MMAPSKDKCVLCCQVFYGKQKFFRCSECERRAHGKCIVLPDEELQCLLAGVQPFRCNLCVAAVRPSDGGALTTVDGQPASIPAGRVAPPVATTFNPTADICAEVAALRTLLSEAVESLSFLGDSVAQLRDENRILRRDSVDGFAKQAAIIASLREEVRCLRGELARRPPSPPPSPKSSPKSSALLPRMSPHSPSPLRPSFAAAAAGASGEAGPLLHCVNVSGSQPAAAMTAMDSHSDYPLLPLPRSDTACTDPPTKTQMKRSTPRVGASEASDLVVVRRPPNTRAIFVSKLSAKTTSGQLRAHLATVDVTPVSCKRLKTKHDSYSSFCVTVDGESFERLGDPSLWPKGCLFKPFQGKFHPGMVHSSELNYNDKKER